MNLGGFVWLAIAYVLALCLVAVPFAPWLSALLVVLCGVCIVAAMHDPGWLPSRSLDDEEEITP